MILSSYGAFQKSEIFGRSGTKRHKKASNGSGGAFRATIARIVLDPWKDQIVKNITMFGICIFSAYLYKFTIPFWSILP